MAELAGLTLDNFLDETASRTPTPGGGSVAAVAGALSCAMARMVTAYSVNKKTEPSVGELIESFAQQLHRADQLFRSLIDQDAAAYANMTAAAKAAKEDESKRSQHQQSVLEAAGVPLQMAALAATVLATLDVFKAHTNKYLVSDLGVASVLALATSKAAAYSVRINIPEIADTKQRDRVRADLQAILLRAESSATSIEAYVQDQIDD